MYKSKVFKKAWILIRDITPIGGTMFLSKALKIAWNELPSGYYQMEFQW